MIELRNICKDYYIGESCVSALSNVDLFLENGGFISIMGPSGSGKSTLMNIIGCLDRQSSGSYFLDGKDMNTLSEIQKAYIRNQKIGFIFQSFFLLPKLSAFENIELPLIYRGIETKERKRRVLRCIDRVSLLDRKDHLPSELSGGQRQRVAIARALINEPQLILADEPTGNLDSKTGFEIMDILKQLNDEGRTLVLITHEEEIGKAAKRHAVIKDGELKEV